MSKTLYFLSLFTFIPHNAIAQIIPDSSLGRENSVVESNSNRDTIKGGAIRDANLFHSFTEFNVEALREVYFTNPDGIANIFSRVTGNNISDIQGVLGVLGDANLYLINPNGILFGENASLDVNGSFFATSADSVLFSNGFEFSAVNPDAPPLLTIDIPVGLRFRDNPGDIVNQSNVNGVGLSVNRGETITLIGGNVRVENGGIVFAPGGEIKLGGLRETGTIGITEDNSLSFPDGIARGDVLVTDSAIISVLSGEGGGSISVNANNFDLTNGSRLIGSIRDELGLAEAKAGDIFINATESIAIDGQDNIDASTGIFTNVGSNAVGNAGNIELNSGSLTLNNGAIFSTSNFGQGNAGNVTINATESIAIDGQGNSESNTGIFSQIGSNAVGNAGNIELNSGSVTLDNGAILFTRNLGTGKAGNVTINAQDNVSLANNSWVFVTGDEGGSININAKNLSITSGSSFFGGIPSDSGFSEAQSGDLKIDLTEDLVIDGLDSQDETLINNSSFGVGNPGNIDISARNISFYNGGQLSSFAVGQENAQSGNISLNATGDILFDGVGNRVNDGEKTSTPSGIRNAIPENALGNIGEINLTAQNLTLTNGGTIESIVSGVANSGDININVTNSIIVDGFKGFFVSNQQAIGASNIASNINKTGQGNTGEINIKTQNLALSRNGYISNSIQGKGNAGNINIDAEQITIGEPGNINLLPSYISATNFGNGGNGGDITINTGSLFIRDGGGVSANVNGVFGTGGNIKINARDIVSLEGTGTIFFPTEQKNLEVSSTILAKVSEGSGNGGNITIDTSQLVINNNAFISADVDNSTGDGGAITITATDFINLSQDSYISSDVDNSTGDGGAITITATDSINLSQDSYISSDVDNSTGDGGAITITATDSINLSQDSQIGSDVVNSTGNGGAITISATNSIEVSENSLISANVFSGSEGNSGNLTIETGKLFVSEGSQISASTFGQGNAGTLTIRATDSIELSGIDIGRSGLFASALEQDGNSGALRVFTQDLIIRDGAIISVGNIPAIEGLRKPGTGEAGSLFIKAKNITLDNDARITAATQAGDKGNISLKVTEDIILRDNSFISAQAFKDATGGNLDIDARFIIAFPDRNNDIIASAEQGDGGNIDITAEALFGIEERPLNPVTNDINASSETGVPGEINIQQPTIDPTSGLLELTQEVVDPAELIAQNVCTQTANSEFIDIGKGGLPPNPDDVLAEDNIEVGLVKPITTSRQVKKTLTTRRQVKAETTRKPPAQGWIFHENGIVELVAYNPHQVGEQRIWDTYRSCQ